MTDKATATALEPLLKALANPLRHRILQALNLRVASPSDLAVELGEPLGNVSYHFKVLLEVGAIEEVETKPVRGALEHFYRATMRPWFDEEEWKQLPVSARRGIFGEILRDIWDDVAKASHADGLDDPRTHISRTWLELDEDGYEEVMQLLASVLDRALELHAEIAPRLAALTPEEREARRTALVMMHFDRASEAATAQRRTD